MHDVASFETVADRECGELRVGGVAGTLFRIGLESERQRKACAVNRWCVAKPAHFANGNETRN